jgi:hypothetical protein
MAIWLSQLEMFTKKISFFTILYCVFVIRYYVCIIGKAFNQKNYFHYFLFYKISLFLNGLKAFDYF